MTKRMISAIAWAGLLAGTLDILTACGMFSIKTGQDPTIVLRFVASGALGKSAMTGGWSTALLGLFFHFVIAYSWTTLFFIVYPKLPRGNWIVYGLVYGVVVWLVMNLVVLPMSQVQQRPFNLSSAIQGAVVLMLMIGLPVSYLAHKFHNR
jgi:uncharacterized membrane protein YagU involved in acid resistance